MGSFTLGFLDNSIKFYFLFIAPIMIAYANRATQTVTPAATIMSMNLALSSLMDYIITDSIIIFLLSITSNDIILRLPPLVCLGITLSIVWSASVREWREELAY